MADKKYGITLDGKEYEVAITDNGSGSYTVGVGSSTYNVTARDIALDNITNHITGLEKTSYYYTGSQIKPALVTDGTIYENIDYIVSYGDNKEIGTGSVTVKAIGSTYTGSGNYTFQIVEAPESIANHVTGLTKTKFAYTGSEIKPELITDGTVTENTDYTVEYQDNTNIGTGKVVVTGLGKYADTSATYPFTITSKDIADHILRTQSSEYEYTGEQIKPTLVTDGTVFENTDYTVSYGENVNVGEGSVTANGKAGTIYEGSLKTVTFNIINPISKHVTGLAKDSYEYTGEEIKPELVTDGTVVVTDDYTVQYQDNINVGTGKVIVTGVDEYTGTVTYTFSITEKE